MNYGTVELPVIDLGILCLATMGLLHRAKNPGKLSIFLNIVLHETQYMINAIHTNIYIYITIYTIYKFVLFTNTIFKA